MSCSKWACVLHICIIPLGFRYCKLEQSQSYHKFFYYYGYFRPTIIVNVKDAFVYRNNLIILPNYACNMFGYRWIKNGTNFYNLCLYIRNIEQYTGIRVFQARTKKTISPEKSILLFLFSNIRYFILPGFVTTIRNVIQRKM